jgi:hypothetical protein
MAHFGHDDYTLNVPYGILRLLKVKIDLGEKGRYDTNWIDLAQDRDQWRALVKMVMNLQVP